jgi:1-aminocyclopropane-1-carboxylate deaminase
MLRQWVQHMPLQCVQIPEWERRGIAVSMWRLDRIDSAAPGNKIFKLSENLRAARALGHARVLSFGGAFSNHLHALALLGAERGFKTVGVVRGEAQAAANPTLRDAAAAGMELHFIDRSCYRSHSGALRAAQLPTALRQQFGDCYVIPEGGANYLGALGCKVLGDAIVSSAEKWDRVVLPCGTGTTLAGLVAGLNGASEVLGIAVLKGIETMVADVNAALLELDATHCARWAIDAEHHCGGYARTTPNLEHFVDYFQRCTGIPIEPVYTGKMLYAIDRRIKRDEFVRGTRLLILHTGGLQGARGFDYRKNQRGDNVAFTQRGAGELESALGEIVRMVD